MRTGKVKSITTHQFFIVGSFVADMLMGNRKIIVMTVGQMDFKIFANKHDGLSFIHNY